eukprot:3303966-Heterocapsa_arctica.AAC.1
MAWHGTAWHGMEWHGMTLLCMCAYIQQPNDHSYQMLSDEARGTLLGLRRSRPRRRESSRRRKGTERPEPK